MGCMWDTAIQGLMPPYCPHLCLTIAPIHTPFYASQLLYQDDMICIVKQLDHGKSK